MKITGPFDKWSFVTGQRIEIHPATDLWMRGDRFGVVETVGWKYLTVRMDITGKKRVEFENVYAIMD